MSVDPLFAQWLLADADYLVAVDGAQAARWGERARQQERRTALATRAGAQAEADRQLAFLARGPFAVEEHVVAGTDWQATLGRVVSLAGDRLGYDAGVAVFVTGVSTDNATGVSQLTVLRPLAGDAA